VNFENVVKSFFLGIVIGLVLQVLGSTPLDPGLWVIGTLVSGSIGLVIGLATEWLTSLLPLRMARTRTYFFVNNLIAVVVTAIVIVLSQTFADEEARSRWDLWSVTAVVVSIVSVANLVDYLVYRRAQQRLRALQATLVDADLLDADLLDADLSDTEANVEKDQP